MGIMLLMLPEDQLEIKFIVCGFDCGQNVDKGMK